jgi:hypothetical protein
MAAETVQLQIQLELEVDAIDGRVSGTGTVPVGGAGITSDTGQGMKTSDAEHVQLSSQTTHTTANVRLGPSRITGPWGQQLQLRPLSWLLRVRHASVAVHRDQLQQREPQDVQRAVYVPV